MPLSLKLSKSFINSRCYSQLTGAKCIPQIYFFAKVYIENFLMPRGLLGDAIHLAYSSYYKVDFLLTWNCNHLANANKEQHIRIVNNKLNLSTPIAVCNCVCYG